MKRRRVDDGESSDESSGSSPRTTPLAERKDNGRELTAGLDEGISSFCPPILFYMENPYRDNK